jgi:hypothetical protein
MRWHFTDIVYLCWSGYLDRTECNLRPKQIFKRFAKVPRAHRTNASLDPVGNRSTCAVSHQLQPLAKRSDTTLRCDGCRPGDHSVRGPIGQFHAAVGLHL